MIVSFFMSRIQALPVFFWTGAKFKEAEYYRLSEFWQNSDSILPRFHFRVEISEKCRVFFKKVATEDEVKEAKELFESGKHAEVT